MKEQTAENNIDTFSTVEKKPASRMMGTRKHPIAFGKGPNVIRNQSEMSYENEDSNNLSYR